MKNKLYQHCWPLLVIFISMLGIYFILYKKEFEYYENIFDGIENIEGFRNNKMKKEALINAMTN
jgi:hypothetical protein